MKKKVIIITSIILIILALAASSVYALWYISSTRLINPADVTSDVVRTYIANGISGTHIYVGDASLSGSPKGQFPSTGNLDSSKLTYYNTDNSSIGTEVAYSNITTKGPIDADTYYFYVSYQKGDETVYVYADDNNSLFSFDITPLEINLSSDDNIDLSYNTSNSTSNVVDTEFKNNYIYSTDRDNISLSASVTSTNSIYYASLSLNGTRANNYTINTTSIPMVAYISTTYYSTIEYALDCSVSGNIVYVIPNTKPSITRACEVKSGVILTFPYEGTTYERSSSDDESPLSGFAINKKDTYCKNTINIKKVSDSSGNVITTITINGTVNIGGQRRSTGPQGCTSGYYVEWLVESDVRIDIYGSLYCMGYIREDSDYNGSVINVYSTGTLIQPMVSYDWGSAGNAKGAIDEGIFPFNYFDCPQVSPSIYFYSGAKLEASVWMYGNSAGDMKANAYIIGDTYDIALVQAKSSDGSDYIYWKNTDKASGITLNNSKTSHEIKLKLYGDYSLSYLEMDMNFKFPIGNIDIPVNIDSSNYFLPFSNFFDIQVMNDASFDVNYPVKFLPGANITIENGGTVNIYNSVIVYETMTSNDGHSIYSYGDNNPAKLTNNGILNINAAFGGKMYAGSNGDSTTQINVTTVGVLLLLMHILMVVT